METKRKGYLWTETHLHTAEVSRCAHMSAKEAVERSAKAGVQSIIVTDHMDPDLPHAARKEKKTLADRYLEGYHAAQRAGKRLGVRILLGMELRITEGNEDYLVFGLDEARLRALGDVTELPFAKAAERVHGVGALIFQAHPYRLFMRPADPALLDGVEVFNANPRHMSRNEKALRFAEANGLRQSAGSDVHQKHDEGRAGIWTPDWIEDSVQLAEWLRREQPELIVPEK